ncbi:hypothetical protein DOY81_000828 [Sarcophaga bullata]|nr:hypothetical protein DOY81_000828 [Sarcophaga bullata]
MGPAPRKEFEKDGYVDEYTDCEPYDMTIMAPWDNLWIDDSLLNKLPNELLIRIFRNLSFNDLLQLRLVCKRWYTLMRLPEFMSKTKLVISHENIDFICDTLRKDKKFRRVLAYENVEFYNLKTNEDMKFILRSIRPTLRELSLHNTPVLINLHKYISWLTNVDFSRVPRLRPLPSEIQDYENSIMGRRDRPRDIKPKTEENYWTIEEYMPLDYSRRSLSPDLKKLKIQLNLQRKNNNDIDGLNIKRRNSACFPKSKSELSGKVDQFKNVDSLNVGFRNLSLGKKRNIKLNLPQNDNVLSSDLNEFTNMDSLNIGHRERNMQLTILRELYPNIEKLAIELNEKHEQLLFHVLERNRDTLKYWEFSVQTSPALVPKWEQLIALLDCLESLKSRWSLLVQ